MTSTTFSNVQANGLVDPFFLTFAAQLKTASKTSGVFSASQLCYHV